jgi:hypothetical protein
MEGANESTSSGAMSCAFSPSSTTSSTRALNALAVQAVRLTASGCAAQVVFADGCHESAALPAGDEAGKEVLVPPGFQNSVAFFPCLT